MSGLGTSHRAPAGLRQLKTHPMFHRVFAASPMEVRGVLGDVRSRFRDVVSEDTLGRLELVLAEVMNNVTEHGPGLPEPSEAPPPAAVAPSIHLCIVRHDAGVACAITDDGVSVPADCMSPRGLPELTGDLPEGGFGWYLIRDLTHSLCYYREDRRNFLAFSIPFPAEDAPLDD